jgi:predicted HTH domain antitoxin
MEINHQELKEKYEELSTDQLLHIKVTSELTDMAQMLLDDELKKRDVSVEDYNIAVRDANIIQADRDSQKKNIKRKIQFHFIYLFIILVVGLYYSYFH